MAKCGFIPPLSKMSPRSNRAASSSSGRKKVSFRADMRALADCGRSKRWPNALWKYCVKFSQGPVMSVSSASDSQSRAMASIWERVKGNRLTKRGRFFARWMAQFVELLKIPPPETQQLIRRITIMERHLVLPIKAAGIVMILRSFYFSPWFGEVLSELEIAVDYMQAFLILYISFNVLLAGVLFAMRWLPLAVIEWAVFVGSLVDGVFVAALTLFTGGYDSILYWLFLAMIVRTAVSVPRATSQLMLNFTLCACYVVAGAIDINIAQNLSETARPLMELPDNPTEPLLLRMTLLLLMTLCCYAVQVLLEKQRQAEEEAREFGMREGQLQSAGRLAAEFVHQMKNPLAIINNAAFSLQRALKAGKVEAAEQIRIIQEEVGRSDRIITELMGD